MRKENDVYRRFNKQSHGANQSGAILERLIEKSQKELVDFKNVQLKKIDRPAEEVKAGPQVPQKSQFVQEQSSGVSALKNMFDPTARQKALEKSMNKVEQELAKGQEQAAAQLAQAQQHLDQLSQQAVTSDGGLVIEDLQIKVLSVEEKAKLIEEKGYSEFQKRLELQAINYPS